MPWEDAPEGFYFTDVKQKTLWKDEETGASMVLMKFPVGLADEVHSHPEANQFMYGLKGEVELPGGVRRSIEGDFLYNTKGEKHGSTNVTKELLLLHYWDGPLTRA